VPSWLARWLCRAMPALYWGVSMCQAKVYLGNQEVAHDVVWLEPIAEGVRFETFFGGLQLVKGRVQRVDFLTHRVSLEPLEEDHGRDHEAAHAAPTLD
jgi:predicted RNA-binding protein